ncbi:MAG: hypothetical protein ACRDMJ_07715 [Solirubrobacteraceae bacterium]
MGAVACALAIAACGSSAGAGTIGTGTGPSTGPNQGLKFAGCMRSHGVSHFPDPSATGSISIGPGSGIDPRSPAFQKAQQSCVKFVPGFRGAGHGLPAAARRRLLQMTQCMRTHGVPDFPDPSFSGGGVRLGGPGIDPQSPAFQTAARACGGPAAAIVRVGEAAARASSAANGTSSAGHGPGLTPNIRAAPGG